MTWLEQRTSEPVRGLNVHELSLDEAYMNVSSRGLVQTAWLYALRGGCFQCPFQLIGSITPESDHIMKLSSQFTWRFRLYRENLGEYASANNDSALLCGIDEDWNIGEFGIYDLELRSQNNSENVTCSSSTVIEPVNIYLPILMLTLVGLALLGALLVGKFLFTRFYKRPNNGNAEETDVLTSGKRLIAIDAFRGLCLVLLLFYNGGGGGYQMFAHTAWDGMPIADVPFPWFLWIMGVCIPISINSALKKSIPRRNLLRSTVSRTLLLFLGGLIVNSVEFGTQLETFRILGVLQRFALLCLLCGGLCALLWPHNVHKLTGDWSDLRVLAPQWIIHLVLHFVYLALSFAMPVPGCPTGYLGPGGLHEDLKYRNCTGGVAGYVDRLLLGAEHLYPTPTCSILYQTGSFDPEGLFSTLPAALTVMLGVQAGSTIVLHADWKRRLGHWVLWGSGCLVAAVALDISGVVPINKNLWSTSFALASAGLAFLTLALVFLVVDVWRFWDGVPLTYLGMNSIVLYLGSKVTRELFPWHWRLGRMDTHVMLLLDTCWSVAVWLLVAFIMFRKRIFISL